MSRHQRHTQAPRPPEDENAAGPRDEAKAAARRPAEMGGREGPDPTRYGDWEKKGRCIDF